MKKTKIDWAKEFDDFSKSGLSQPQYCKEKRLKYTTYRYHWEKRSKNSEKNELVEIPNSSTNAESLEVISKTVIRVVRLKISCT
ncbi:IS66 family insertion sequence element accessory protein TnpA [Leptospira mayottensis]|uniref:Transposase n=2 Tax=Leptospira mayottensis TaxID=1137606 RepID=A0AA87MM45_9LEPT|nr:hypothetical protein [Leptospira mayottensis]AXR64032.1 hypothetical protein DQM28_07145 [Leptospira mayottensis]EKR98719.1 hypothetical protein LEP1GSC125_4301 [Leptospira mayottensis 200901122]